VFDAVIHGAFVMKFFPVALVAVAATLLSDCVVAPLGVRPVVVQPAYSQQVYGPPPGVVVVQPTCVLPALGYVWGYHARFGWGWRHPQYGWHRGWR
jgi:hypothetical protein